MARVDVKVVLLGSSGVGKTALLERWVNDKFEPGVKNTIGAAFAAKKVKTHGGSGPDCIALGVWDTAGAEQFESLSRMYYHGSRAAIVCFDASQPQTFEKLQFWVRELRNNEPDCRIYLVQTKADLSTGSSSASCSSSSSKPAVPNSAVQQYASSIKAPVIITSAKTGIGVKDLFQDMAETLAEDLAKPGMQGLPRVNAQPPVTSPQSHSVVLSPGQSLPSARGSAKAASGGSKQSSCC